MVLRDPHVAWPLIHWTWQLIIIINTCDLVKQVKPETKIKALNIFIYLFIYLASPGTCDFLFLHMLMLWLSKIPRPLRICCACFGESFSLASQMLCLRTVSRSLNFFLCSFRFRRSWCNFVRMMCSTFAKVVWFLFSQASREFLLRGSLRKISNML